MAESAQSEEELTARAFQRVLRRFHIPQPRIMETVPAAVRRNREEVTTALNQLFRRYNGPSSAEAR